MTVLLHVEGRQLVEPLAVSHTVVRSVDVIRLSVRGPYGEGLGEVTVGPWDPTPAGEVRAAVEELTSGLKRSFPAGVEQVRALLAPAYHRLPAAATAVVEMALLDALATGAGVPLWRLLELERPVQLPLFTTVDVLDRERPWERQPGSYKVKLGGPHDGEVLASCARAVGSRFVFDVNSGWDLETYRGFEGVLAACDPLAVEDPVRDITTLEPVRETWRERRLVLDESMRTPQQVRVVAGDAYGINVKLLKFGGLLSMLDAARAARAGGCRLMLGCFVESARAIAYAATLTGLADFADLDGERWLTGVVRDGDLVTDAPGIGVPA